MYFPDIYASWVKGLPQDRKALEILRDSGAVAGIEMSNIDEQVDMVQNGGLKFSAHTPGLNLTLNLAAPDFLRAFTCKEPTTGARLFKIIKESDAPVVGFHLGYSAKKVFKMMAFPNIPSAETIITDRKELLNEMSQNLATLSMIFGSLDEPKSVLIETLDWSRKGKAIPWDKQIQEALDNQEAIQRVMEQYGVNAGLLYVTEPDFVKEIFEMSDILYPDSPNSPIGFIFDIAHNFIAADAKIHDGLFSGSIEDYFQSMLNVVKDRTYQLHLTVPAGNDEVGYADHHRAFTPGDPLSDRIMELSKMVFSKTPHLHLDLITLEIKTDLPPIEHAKAMVKQAEYVIKELDL